MSTTPTQGNEPTRSALRPADPSPRPAPPGGAATPPSGRPRVRWWLLVLIGLLVVNYWAGSRAMHAQSRTRIPYSPFFVQQIDAGNVSAITSKGTAIQGTFKEPTSYAGSKAATRFKTEIPAFADTQATSELMQPSSAGVN